MNVVAKDIHALIQAGGQGTRMQPLSGSLPKHLLRVGGTPIIKRLVMQLVACGIQKITIVLRNNNQTIKACVDSISDALPTKIQFFVMKEELPLGNAGALGVFENCNNPVLLAFGDLVTSLDFATMINIHKNRGCDVTLASHFEEHQLSLGELITAGEIVCSYVEKPRKKFLICSGIAIFEPSVIELAKKLQKPFGLVDLISATIKAGYRVTHWLHLSHWIDVNTPELLEQARKEVSERHGQDI
jgi:mannose-1-phosphate guanylyltransferase